MYVCKVVVEWRSIFYKDVVVDLVCYWCNGYNEMDEFMFMQLFMYKQICKQKFVLQKYVELLVLQGVVNQFEYEEEIFKYDKICEEVFVRFKDEKILYIKYWLDFFWFGFFILDGQFRSMFCFFMGLMEDILIYIGNVVSFVFVENFIIYGGLSWILKICGEMVKNWIVDWVLVEYMVFGLFLKEGIYIWLSGQDVEWGIFSYCYYVFYDQNVDKRICIFMNYFWFNQVFYIVCNSLLFEYGVLGFELGFVMVSFNVLVFWEV